MTGRKALDWAWLFVQRIDRGLGGSIRVTSEAGKGSVFYGRLAYQPGRRCSEGGPVKKSMAFICLFVPMQPNAGIGTGQSFSTSRTPRGI